MQDGRGQHGPIQEGAVQAERQAEDSSNSSCYLDMLDSVSNLSQQNGSLAAMIYYDGL